MTTYEIDATNQSVGRLSTKIATILRGKHLASYEPRLLPQFEVVVTNLDKVKFTGSKTKTKKYFHYSGYPGGMKTKVLDTVWDKNPKFVLRQSVYRMLPVNRTRDKIIKNLKFK
jgi:large subunit ribosomal protein L13